MKKVFIFVFIFKATLFFSQSKKIDYGMMINDKSIGRFSESWKNFNSDSQMVFSLIYNDSVMKFMPNAIDDIDDADFHLNLICASTEHIFYKKLNSNRVTCFSYFKKLNEEPHEKTYILKWTIQSETKNILGKTCTKAIGTYTANSIWDAKDVEHNMVAWFAPEVQPSFGPRGIGGLPGAILELKFICCTFKAIKIEENWQETIEMPKNFR
jgi:GLPGLI family protein